MGAPESRNPVANEYRDRRIDEQTDNEQENTTPESGHGRWIRSTVTVAEAGDRGRGSEPVAVAVNR